ncbi:MAG: transglutaminase family protein [Myxococcales bacterium]|nr:transglutaminase family protein [Myxococcales bacterium]
MRVRIKHKTLYRYGEPAALGAHVVRLRPAEHARARLLSYNLGVAPECQVRWQHDPWANRIARLTFLADQRHDFLEVTVDAAFDIRPVNPFDFFVDDRCETVPFGYPDGLREELKPFLVERPLTPALAKFVEEVPLAGSTTDYLVALNLRVAQRVNYVLRDEAGIQSAEETLTLGRGSCRDSAVLLVDTLRARGLAARFVSGYLIQLVDEGNIVGEAKGVDRDVIDLHAWAEVYIPGAGWIGLDGTSGLFCGEGHIPLASAVNPELAAPISGTSSVPASTFEFAMEIERLGHEARPREPYPEHVWNDILGAGDSVDAFLESEGVALTSGGEPTWTSRIHPTEPEWNTEALGSTKWAQGLRLAQRLRGELGTGTLILQSAGKQYPGESLPRWATHLIWRKDGVPLWRDPSLLDLRPPVDEKADAKKVATDLETLAMGITDRLGVEAEWIPGYEDPWHFVRAEEDVPNDINPLEMKLHDDEERRRLARVLEKGLGNPIGFAVPIQWWEGRWVTGPWAFRRSQMFLVPGDSPMGLRLPLHRLPGKPPPTWTRDTTIAPPNATFDPREAPEEYSGRSGVAAVASKKGGAKRKARKGDEQSAHRRTVAEPGPAAQTTVEQTFGEGTVLRTSICVEARDGALCVFLPPLPTLEAFLEMVAACEDAAAALGQPIRVEGYPPPSDPRIVSCLVTPDPGVIEVNLPVCGSFREYRETLETISDAANHADLRTEKYQLDGRRAGSGGGNHLTLGGPSTVESPFLREPHLVGSLLRYFQNHPCLSYLFTGLFVGPTSQAPRVDEARLDSLDELELALAQIPPPGEAVPPWTIDRLLRNLLVDVSGSTHRTEICIDKLYAPGGPAGRLGVLELRAFEMPPHEHMAAVQMLLVRTLVARFAKKPYEQPLIRWGTDLHDRFMLPHFLWKDMADVVNDVRRAGLPMELEWFRPFLDFRFPVCGTLDAEGVELEVRTALEPWPTLGEQPVGSVVARYVDSSLERVQVRARGLVPGRHEVTVNGFRLPLHSTGTVGEGVAGVRFRAWQPPHCLQPAIPIHHPLRFDVIDTWGERSLGACAYHVWHPEGRAFDEPPLTAVEAAARSAQRFTTEGHMPWPAQVKPTVEHPSHPFTLDLRYTSLLETR